jgi:hypothetical protein
MRFHTVPGLFSGVRAGRAVLLLQLDATLLDDLDVALHDGGILAVDRLAGLTDRLDALRT